MQVVNIRRLKTNPSAVLRDAKQGLVMVTNDGKPEAILVSMEQLTNIPNLDQVRSVLGLSMFKDNQLSIAAAAKVAGKSLSEMLSLVSEAGIPVVDCSEEEAETEAKLAEKLINEIKVAPSNQ